MDVKVIVLTCATTCTMDEALGTHWEWDIILGICHHTQIFNLSMMTAFFDTFSFVLLETATSSELYHSQIDIHIFSQFGQI